MPGSACGSKSGGAMGVGAGAADIAGELGKGTVGVAGVRTDSEVLTWRKRGGAPHAKAWIVKLLAFVPEPGGDVHLVSPGHVEDYHV